MANHYKGAKYPQSLYQCQCPACRYQAVQLNKWVLRLDLNNCSDWRFLIFSGSRFHASGADTAKERSPNLSQSGQRRGHRAWTIVVGFCHWQLTQADVCKILRCKTTLSLVDQQTRVCIVYPLFNRQPMKPITLHTIDVMWSNLFSPQMSCPVLFITTCSLLSWYWGAPACKYSCLVISK